MAWIQIKIPTVAEDAAILGDRLMDLGAQSISFEAENTETLIEKDHNKHSDIKNLWEEVLLIALFDEAEDLDSIKMELTTIDRDLSKPLVYLTIEHLPDQDWQKKFQDNLKPLEFENNLWVIPSWLQAPVPDATNVILDPGMAFGTGAEVSTALCLDWIATKVQQDDIVIDYGCGSGILGIAAAKLDAAKVYAVDIDQQAINTCKNNALKNNIDEKIFAAMLPSKLPDDTKADIVVANILSNTLIELAPSFVNLLKPTGKLALCGILTDQLDEIISVYKHFFAYLKPVVKEQWVRIECISPIIN